MKAILIITALLFSFQATANLKMYNSSGVSLGVKSDFKCSTGLTCSVVAGKFQVSSSPSLTSALSISGAEATDAIFTMAADESDDSGDDWQFRSVASGNALTISNDASGSQVTKLSIAASTGNVSLVGDLAGDGGDQLYGFLNNQVAATAVTITAAQCGSTFINSGAVEMDLPEASTVLGCRLTFITGNASNFDIDPDAADQILVQTDAAGDRARNATLGNSITIEAISASQWAPVSVIGTWSDAN